MRAATGAETMLEAGVAEVAAFMARAIAPDMPAMKALGLAEIAAGRPVTFS